VPTSRDNTLVRVPNYTGATEKCGVEFWHFSFWIQHHLFSSAYKSYTCVYELSNGGQHRKL